MTAPRAAALPQNLQDQTEASCFYHAQNRATAPCAECGRFLCSLCAIEVPSRTICPTCLESGVSSKRAPTLETGRVMHDSIALGLATWPAMLIWPAAISAPLSIFWAIRHWNSPSSLLPRTRVRLYFALVFALLKLVMVGFLIFGIVLAMRTQR